MARKKEEEKKAKEVRKKQLKTLRRELRTLIAGCSGKIASRIPQQLDDLIAFIGDDVDHLSALMHSLQLNNQPEVVESTFNDEIEKMEETRQMEREEEERKRIEAENEMRAKQNEAKQSASIPWTEEEVKQLIKAANLFPGGTLNRWERIAEHVRDHSGSDRPLRKSEEIIRKSKEVRQGNSPAVINIITCTIQY